MQALLGFLLESDPAMAPIESFETWWARHLTASRSFESTLDQAAAGGFVADRPGWAFASGYQAALRALVPTLPRERVVSLCATEEGGAHPRAIAARLSPVGKSAWSLSGRKRWATLAPRASVLLVVASEGIEANARKRLRLVCIELPAAGVSVTTMPAPPFAPEIEHGEVSLEVPALADAALLPGDGYARYLKPFRTIEDCHVYAALLAYVLRIARREGWAEAMRERALALLAAARGVGAADPSSPATHLALAGLLREGRRFFEDARGEWLSAPADERARWERDAPLLDVAESTRRQRAERAWEFFAWRARESRPEEPKD